MAEKTTITQKLAKDLGRRARQKVLKLDPRLADWDVFRRTLGFYQWKQKNQLTDELVEAFGEGFRSNQA